VIEDWRLLLREGEAGVEAFDMDAANAGLGR